MNQPKHLTFFQWLRTTGQIGPGQIGPEQLGALTKEWNQIKHRSDQHKVYTTDPITWDQFVASKYPRKVLAYQAYLRLIGAAPDFRKD